MEKSFRINHYLLLFSLLVLISCGSKTHTPVDNPSIIDTAPKFGSDPQSDIASRIAATAVGQAFLAGDITDYKGKKKLLVEGNKPKLIGYWASWCEPCHEDRPHLEKLIQKYPQIDFYYLSIDKKMEEAQAYFDKKQKQPASYDYWLGNDPNQPLQWYTLNSHPGGNEEAAVRSIPTYVLVSSEGKVLEKRLPRPSTGNMEGSVRKLLEM